MNLIHHPVYWFNDGSIILCVEDQAFKVHKTLLSRHSPFFSQNVSISDSGRDVTPDSHIHVDPSRSVRAKDVEALLEHFYHDAPLVSEVRLSRIAAVLRVSSPQQLDFPSIHAFAKKRLNLIAPSGYSPSFSPEDPEEVLALATEYQIHSMRKALYYHFVTSPGSHFDPSGSEASSEDSIPPIFEPETESADPGAVIRLSPTDAKLCAQLMERLIEYFTPVLFTPPATPHMACTDVFADTWMSLVIQPAIEDDGVYKPLETLERIKGIDWAKSGLCDACVKEKCGEWTQEQEHIWNVMDTWLALPVSV